MHNITDKILSYIDEKNIHSLPRWWFVGKNILFWLCFIIFAILGAKAFGLILLEIVDADMPFLWELQDASISWLQVLPVLWLVLLCVFGSVAFLFFRHTKEGYRYKFGTIFIINLGISIVLGSVSFALGISEFTDEYINVVFPQYTNIREQRQALWTHPEAGRISGRVINVFDNETFLLEDFEHLPWTIDGSTAMRRPGTRIEPGFELRIVGLKIKEGEFRAKILAPMTFHEVFRAPNGNHLRKDMLPKPLLPMEIR